MAHEQPGTNNQEKIATVGQFAERLSKEEKAQAAADLDDLVQETLLVKRIHTITRFSLTA